MSFPMIFQYENKKTFGGYLWTFLSLSTAIALLLFGNDLTNPNTINQFVSTLILIASPLSLIAITIRPEKGLNIRFFGDPNISPYYILSKKEEILQIIYSPFLSKDYDHFWGNFLVSIGILISAAIPFLLILRGKGDADPLFGIEVIIGIICLLSSGYIGLFQTKKLREDFRKKLIITWRYYEMITQPGWKKEYNSQIESLENSIRLKLWEKAESQLYEFDELYKNQLDYIYRQSSQLLFSYYFLLGDMDQESVFLQFKIDEFRSSVNRVKILGLEYHKSEIYRLLHKLMIDFDHLKELFEYFSSMVDARLKIIEQNTGNFKKDSSNDFQSELHNHLESFISHVQYVTGKKFLHIPESSKFTEFNLVKAYVLDNKIKGLTHWFENRETTIDFILNITKDVRKKFTKAVKKCLGNNPSEEVHKGISIISTWIFEFLKLEEKEADFWWEEKI